MRFLKFLVFPIFVFSFEVEFHKKFYHELPHDILSANISITIKDNSELKVSDRLDVFNQKIKSFDKVERKLISFNIRPKYRHSGNTPKITGFSGKLRYKINSRKAIYMNEFITEIASLKNNRDTVVSVSNLSWSVREGTYNVSLDLLRLESINWIQTYISNLSKDLNRNCEIKSIQINQEDNSIRYKMGEVYDDTSLATNTLSVPEANQEKIVINSKYILECK